MSRRRAFFGAFVLSFAAYLIPLFNVHAGLVPLGLTLVALAEPSAFSLAILAGALAIQAIVFALFYWALRGLRWRNWLALIVAAPILFYGANLAMLYVIPLMVLVERDARPESGELAKVCSVPGVILAQVHSGAELSLERAGEAWVIGRDDRLRARLTMPGCRLAPVAAPKVGSSMDHVAPGGYLLFRRENGDLAHAGPDRGDPLAVAAPTPGKYWSPILADDGQTLAWLDRQPVQQGPRPYRLNLLPADSADRETIALDLPPREQFELIGADTENDRFTLARFRNAILAIDGQGRTIMGPVSPPGVYDARWGFCWLGGGWVAWDGYREEGRWRIVWSLPAGNGEVVIPRGRNIESLAVDPGGRHIAVSVATSLSIGSTKSAVFVFRTAGGQEFFRRYHPEFSRIRLAFLGAGHLAMTRTENGQSFIDVYRVP
jgi:hypothetical protein